MTLRWPPLLRSASSLGIVHRDLKTDNVFLKHIPNDGVFYKFVVGPKAASDVERILGRKPEHILMPKVTALDCSACLNA